MDKIKVRTDGDYMMQDPTSGEVIEAYGESEVTRTNWVEQQIVNGKLKSDVKIDKDELQNPGTEETVSRAKAPAEGEVRGASKSKDPARIDRTKQA